MVIYEIYKTFPLRNFLRIRYSFHELWNSYRHFSTLNLWLSLQKPFMFECKVCPILQTVLMTNLLSEHKDDDFNYLAIKWNLVFWHHALCVSSAYVKWSDDLSLYTQLNIDKRLRKLLFIHSTWWYMPKYHHGKYVHSAHCIMTYI